MVFQHYLYKITETKTAQHPTHPYNRPGNKNTQIQTQLPQQTNIAQFYNLFVNPVTTNQRKRLTENNCNSMTKKELFFISELWRALAPDTKEWNVIQKHYAFVCPNLYVSGR